MNTRDVDIFGYSLGGSVSEMMNPVERRLPELTPAQIANLAASYPPGAASLDIAGEFPQFPTGEMTTEEMLAGPRAPSLAENLAEGEYFSGIMQALGGLGDAASVIPAVGPLIGGVLKTPRALQRLLQVGETLEEGIERTRKAFERGETGAREEYLILRNARDDLGEDFIDKGIGSITATKGAGDDVSYRMMHTPTTPQEGAARLDDMTGGGEVFPDDIYSSRGLQFYGDPSNKFDRESFEIIQAVKGNPEAEVTVYRAVPKGVREINPGDFVTLSPEYAKMHGMSGYGAMGDEAGEVISMKVKVKEVFSDGNDLNEFGFFPMERLQRAKDAGFDTDTVYYHGADDDITEFRMPSRETGQTKTVGTGVFMTSSPEVAGSYSKTQNAVTYPVFIKKSEFVTVRPAKKGQYWSDISTDGLVAEFPDGTTKPASEVFDLDDSYTDTDELSRVARSKGFKGLIIEDVIDAGIGGAGEYRYTSKYLQDRGYDVSLPIGTTKESYEKLEAVPDDILAAARAYAKEQLMRPADVVVSFDPKNIRSVNAKFEELDTAEILKASGGEIRKSQMDLGIGSI